MPKDKNLWQPEVAKAKSSEVAMQRIPGDKGLSQSEVNVRVPERNFNRKAQLASRWQTKINGNIT